MKVKSSCFFPHLVFRICLCSDRHGHRSESSGSKARSNRLHLHCDGRPELLSCLFFILGQPLLPRPIVHNPETHSRSHVFRSSMGVFYFSPATPMWCRVSPTTVVPICQDHCPFRVVKTNWVWTFCLVPQSLPSMYSRILGKAFFLNRTSETTGQGHFFSW